MKQASKKPKTRKPPEQARSTVVPIRLTQIERDELQSKARDASVSLSEYVRRAAFLRRLPPRSVPEVNRETYVELARVGNNLNQLMRAIHEGRVQVLLPEALAQVQDVLTQFKELGFLVIGREVDPR